MLLVSSEICIYALNCMAIGNKVAHNGTQTVVLDIVSRIQTIVGLTSRIDSIVWVWDFAIAVLFLNCNDNINKWYVYVGTSILWCRTTLLVLKWSSYEIWFILRFSLTATINRETPAVVRGCK